MLTKKPKVKLTKEIVWQVLSADRNQDLFQVLLTALFEETVLYSCSEIISQALLQKPTVAILFDDAKALES